MNRQPKISVLIPTYNRRGVLLLALEALAKQSVPHEDFEVIVSDDGSDDGTRTAVQASQARLPFTIRYLYQSNSGANAARNRAIEIAEAPLLLIINDDTIGVERLVAEHLQMHARNPQSEVAVLGRMTISPSIPQSLFGDLHLDDSFRGFEGRVELDWRAFFTCNISVKKSFLLEHGIFDEGLRWHEDVELGERLSHAGLRVLYCPEALGYHHHLLTERDYLRIAEKEGVALALWYRKAPHLTERLGEIGFHRVAPRSKRVVYHAADFALNPITLPLALRLARAMGRKWPHVGQNMYRKIFQAIKRRSTEETLSM